MRLRRDPQALLKLAATPYLTTILPLSVSPPLIVELGAGKGTMLTRLAQTNPAQFFVGIDREASVLLKAARKASDLALTNLQLIVGDGKDLKTFFDKPIDALWLTFPDPWPKVRHASRRLTSRQFLLSYHQVLGPNASLLFKTDNDALFNWTLGELAAANYQVLEQTNDLANSTYALTNTPTDYELKWAAKGKTINYLRATPKANL